MGFGIAFVIGTLAGSAASALVGGTLMGTGSIMAGGCNIGQGLSGVSTLAIGSLTTAGATFLGAILGAQWLQTKT